MAEDWKKFRKSNLYETHEAYDSAYKFLEEYLSLEDKIYHLDDLKEIDNTIAEYIGYIKETTDLKKEITRYRLNMGQPNNMNKLNALEHILNVCTDVIDGLRNDLRYLKSRKDEIEDNKKRWQDILIGFIVGVVLSLFRYFLLYLLLQMLSCQIHYIKRQSIFFLFINQFTVPDSFQYFNLNLLLSVNSMWLEPVFDSLTLNCLYHFLRKLHDHIIIHSRIYSVHE